jgi:hypothetical protein
MLSAIGRPSRRGEKRQNYDPMKLQMAVEAVQSGLMNPSKASAHFQVPRATIYSRMKNTSNSINSGTKWLFIHDRSWTVVLTFVVFIPQEMEFWTCCFSWACYFSWTVMLLLYSFHKSWNFEHVVFLEQSCYCVICVNSATAEAKILYVKSLYNLRLVDKQYIFSASWKSMVYFPLKGYFISILGIESTELY